MARVLLRDAQSSLVHAQAALGRQSARTVLLDELTNLVSIPRVLEAARYAADSTLVDSGQRRLSVRRRALDCFECFEALANPSLRHFVLVRRPAREYGRYEREQAERADSRSHVVLYRALGRKQRFLRTSADLFVRIALTRSAPKRASEEELTVRLP